MVTSPSAPFRTFSLRAEPFPAETLGVADHGVKLGVGDRLEHARGLGEVGGERLLDQHRHAALDRGQHRLDMQMLVGGDDGASDFRPRQQLAMAGGDEIGADARTDVAAAIVIKLGDADPFHRGVARRHFAAEQADAAGADNGEAYAFCTFSHSESRCWIPLIPATAGIQTLAELGPRLSGDERRMDR